jgi:hypothetical protein
VSAHASAGDRCAMRVGSGDCLKRVRIPQWL